MRDGIQRCADHLVGRRESGAPQQGNQAPPLPGLFHPPLELGDRGLGFRVPDLSDERIDALNADRDLGIMIMNAISLPGVDTAGRGSGLDLLNEFGEQRLFGRCEPVPYHVQTVSLLLSVQSIVQTGLENLSV